MARYQFSAMAYDDAHLDGGAGDGFDPTEPLVASEFEPGDADLPRSDRMTRLARALPSLAGISVRGEAPCAAPGVDPWDAEALDAWAAHATEIPEAALMAARFVLAVWDPTKRYQCGAFQVHDALAAWDGRHRAVFEAWVSAPWWAINRRQE